MVGSRPVNVEQLRVSCLLRQWRSLGMLLDEYVLVWVEGGGVTISGRR